jgi:excisionase family DNA binding protein
LEKRFIGVIDLAQYLSVSPNTVRCWVWKRRIPSHRLGRLVRFDLREIDTWVKDKKIEELS